MGEQARQAGGGTRLEPVMRWMAAHTILIDRQTAEIAGAFEAEGIETLVLKGPVLAKWLYPGEVRPYGDSDLMVAPGDWDGAVALLERLGFDDQLGPMAHPRMESYASTAFLRGDQNVDLHCALHGLRGEMQPVWEDLRAGAERQPIGGASLMVPGRPALLLHIGLHAAHHAEGKALEDLRRALVLATQEQWQQALALARSHDGVPAFASGLRLVPAGLELARRLGIEDVRSAAHEIRFDAVPTAEAIDALLAPGLSLRARAATVLRELFPRPEFMRWRSSLARRGLPGLLASYPQRWLWLARHAPAGLLAVSRRRRL
jgi:hypothetical protein